MKKVYVIVFVLMSLVACNQKNKFTVSGTIADAQGKMLYIEHSGLMKTTVLDSIKLSSSGDFSFKGSRPAFPDFYTLRLENKSIVFAVDSCETIEVKGQLNDFANVYQITGSSVSQEIQELRKSLLTIQLKANSISVDMGADERNRLLSELENEIELHKTKAKNIILKNPASLSAYFALYQKINEIYLFSAYNKSDAAYFKAVATAYNMFMPEYERSKNIYILVMDAIKSERNRKADENWRAVLDKQGIGYINIILKDANNNTRKLSDLEGKLVLIDFSTLNDAASVDYIFAMRDLYTKYHKRGLEIYQVSLDTDKEAWQSKATNLPWICVRDEDGPNSKFAANYNVSSIPTTFLLNKKGIIVARSIPFSKLPEVIEKSL